MQTKRSFGIIGGDLRQYYLAKSLLHDNNNVSVFGFERITKETDNFKNCPYLKLLTVPNT